MGTTCIAIALPHILPVDTTTPPLSSLARTVTLTGSLTLAIELEKLASSSAPVIRHTSTSERTWLQLLVDKYADDYAAMSRDRKLNVWQKTQGEIKRAVSKAGGVEKLSRA